MAYRNMRNNLGPMPGRNRRTEASASLSGGGGFYPPRRGLDMTDSFFDFGGIPARRVYIHEYNKALHPPKPTGWCHFVLFT